MATNFIPPIPIGQFRPSSEAIASWLYEVWKYLQEHPIPSAEDITGDAEEVAENYVTVNVPPMIAQAIAALSYNDFVNGTSLPIYRASNDEIGPEDLLEAWNEGCRLALVDDENVFIMYKDGNTVSLVQVLTEAQSAGVVSVNGESGIVTLDTSDIPNNSNVSGNTASNALNSLKSANDSLSNTVTSEVTRLDNKIDNKTLPSILATGQAAAMISQNAGGTVKNAVYIASDDLHPWMSREINNAIEYFGIPIAHSGVTHVDFEKYDNVNLIGITFWTAATQYFRLIIGMTSPSLWLEYFDGTNTNRVWTATVT